MLNYIIVILSIIGCGSAGHADIFNKCLSSDKKCLKEAAEKAIPHFAKGIPELNVEPMDPLYVKYLDASTSNLKLVITDAKIEGLGTCKPKKIQRDLSKGDLLFVRLICDVKAGGHYDMKGQIIVVPFEGNGIVNITINKIGLNADIEMTTKSGPDGKDYWQIKKWTYSYDLHEKADLEFHNLFPNNPVLRTSATEVIAKNSNEVIKEVGDPIFKHLAEKIIKNLEAAFNETHLEDLVLY